MNGFRLELRLDWSELDLFGHINNVMYAKYMQSSRVNFWEHLGFFTMYETEKRSPILAATQIQFKKPLFYPDTITIEAQTHWIKQNSFGIIHHVWNGKHELVATAEDVMVMFDFNIHQKMEIPAPFYTKLQAVLYVPEKPI